LKYTIIPKILEFRKKLSILHLTESNRISREVFDPELEKKLIHSKDIFASLDFQGFSVEISQLHR